VENKSNNPLVSIGCITYNQVNYIKNTIEGFLLQRTTFPIEIIIHDDASNDNTQQIIREYEEKYPNLIGAIYQSENQYSKGVKPLINIVFNKARGKYIAICEGDDYWIDPYKLQKQVDFLENNTEFGLVFTDVQIIDKNNSVIENGAYNIRKRYSSGWIFTELLKGNFINTCTVVLRKDLIPSSMNNPDKTWFIYDYWLWLRIAINSKICFMNEITTAYRILDNSVSRSPGFKDRRKSYYLFSDVLEAFGNENKRVLAKEEKEIILRKLISLFFQPYGSFSLKLKLLGLIAKYFPGLVGFIHILKSKYKPVSVN
jgi:glycosyltransferase involved in cell wall biosynthesis